MTITRKATAGKRRFLSLYLTPSEAKAVVAALRVADFYAEEAAPTQTFDGAASNRIQARLIAALKRL